MFGRSINNPFYIRYTPLYHWAGFEDKRSGFVVFDSMEMGLRASILCMRSYCRLGKLTPSSIILLHDFPLVDDNRKFAKRINLLSGVSFISSVEDALNVLKAFLYDVDGLEVSVDYLLSLMDKYNISKINFFINPKNV